MSAVPPLLRVFARSAVLSAVFICGTSHTAVAQSQTEQSLYRTRRNLDSLALVYDRNGNASEAAAVRERLRIGDFYPGDRLVLELFGGEDPYRDTVSVRVGQEVVVQNFPAFSLKGVLRAEADSALKSQISKFIRTPVVRTQPLVRLLVTGAVGRPGFVTLRGDAAVSDVVSMAGGLAQNSEIRKSKMRRGSDVLLKADSLSTIFRVGMTLDQADIRAGDELFIEQKATRNFTQVIWAGSAAIGLVLSLLRLGR